MAVDNEKELAIKKKCQKAYPLFVDAQSGKDTTELETGLLRYAKYREESEMAKKKDEALNNAKELVKDLNAPYREALAALKDKMAYLHVLIEEQRELHGEEKERQVSL